MRTLNVVGGRRATPDELAEATRIEQVVTNQLPSVRAAAQNWRNGLGLASVASATVTFAASSDVIKSAPHQQVVDGGWLLALGALLAMVSLGAAMRASFGWPRYIKITSPRSLREWESRELWSSVVALRVSLFAALIAFIFFAAATAVLVFHVPLPFHFPGWPSAAGK